MGKFDMTQKDYERLRRKPRKKYCKKAREQIKEIQMDKIKVQGETELQKKIIRAIENHKAGEVIHALEVIKLRILLIK